MKEWLLTKIREKSTWAGLAAIVSSLTFIPSAESVAASLAVIGAAVSGLVAIWVKEETK